MNICIIITNMFWFISHN